MKQTILSLCLALFISLSGYGQGSAKVGLSGGLLNTNADFDFTLSSLTATNNTGFYIGLAVDVEATSNFHIQPELLYGSAGDLAYIYLRSVQPAGGASVEFFYHPKGCQG